MSTAKPETTDLPLWNEGKTPRGWRQLRAFEIVRAGDIFRRGAEGDRSGRWEPAYHPGLSAGCDKYFRRIPATVAEALKTDYRELVAGELTAKGDLWRIGASTRRQASAAEIAAAALEVAPFGDPQEYEPRHFHSYGRYRLLPEYRDGVIPEGFVRVELGELLRAGDLCSAGPVWRSIGSMFVGDTVHLEIFIRPIVAASASIPTPPKAEVVEGLETAPKGQGVNHPLNPLNPLIGQRCNIRRKAIFGSADPASLPAGYRELKFGELIEADDITTAVDHVFVRVADAYPSANAYKLPEVGEAYTGDHRWVIRPVGDTVSSTPAPAPTEVAKPAKTATEEQDEAFEAANDKFTEALTAARAAFEQLDSLVQLPPDEPVDVRVLGPDKTRVTLTLNNDQLDTFHAAVRLIGGKRTNGWVTPLCEALRDLPRYQAQKSLEWGDLIDWQQRQNVSGNLAFHG